jgi:hypothetical protein
MSKRRAEFKQRANLYSKYIDELSDKELLDELQSYYHTVEVVECFGSKDVVALQALWNEAVSRGFEIDEGKNLIITRPEEES